LWRVRSDGAGRRLLYTDRFNSDLGATVSPNGRWVLLQVLVGANQELWVIGSDGRGLHALAVAADGADLTTTAAWSPRGDRLFVVEDRTSVGPPPYSLPGSTTQVAFVIRPDGTARRSVHYPTSASGQVLWSPDERDLAYGVDASVVIAPLSGATSRTVLTANSPPTLGATGPATLDWQAVPGTGLPFSCLDGRRNRAELSAGRG
jgi:Tol biopolymer transport system component